MSLLSQPVDGLLGCSRGRRDYHHDVIGVLGKVLVDQWVVSPRYLCEFGGHIHIGLFDMFHRLNLLALDLEVVVGQCQGSVGDRIVYVKKRKERVSLSDELPYGFIVHELDRLKTVTGDEPVLTDEDRKKNFFLLRDTHGHYGGVVNLLAILAVDMDPAGIPLRHTVAVVAMDVDGSPERPVDQAENDRSPVRSGYGENFMHKGYAVCTGCCHHPCT